MEGPTPVSALIHAATMVTAGVFMVARFSPLFEYAPAALAVVCVIGGTTAIFAASIGLVQPDIKRVIAYSTCSQLGYMFLAAGVSAYDAAIFHLMTHAFFKALLFLGSGCVIHALSGDQDMRRMGGLGRFLPWTRALMWIGSLALAGIWPFAGYYSKDVILEAAWASGSGVGLYAFCLGIVAAFMTAFYSWRLLFLTFQGTPRAAPETMRHAHEAPWVMIAPLLLLATGAVVAGRLGFNLFVGDGRADFWRDSILVLPAHDTIEGAHHAPFLISILPLVLGLLGIATAWYMYIRQTGLPAQLAQTFRPIYTFLLHKWYFDELYDFLFVRPAFWLGRNLWKRGDGTVIDGFGPDGVSEATIDFSVIVSRLQTGYLYHYAFAMLIGVVVLVSWYYLLPLVW
jgi:NADH-quinone oxidoreductase subunit L